MTPPSSTEGADPAAIEKDIEGIRSNLDGLVAELDHRRHRLNPFRAMRNHPAIFGIAGLALVAGVITYRSRRKKPSAWPSLPNLIEKGKRLKHAADRLMAGKPIEQPPGIGMKALAAATSAVAVIAARRLARGILSRT